MGRNAALLLIHGMGEQNRHELTDDFVRNLTDVYNQKRKDSKLRVKLEHRVVENNEGSDEPVSSYVRMKMPRSREVSGFDRIDVHEVYWADKPQGLIQLKETLMWLLRTTFVPFRAWAQHAALLTGEVASRWRRLGLWVRELVLVALLPLFGVGLVAFGKWLPGWIKDYWSSTGKELQRLAGDLPYGFSDVMMLIALVAAAFITVAAVWGAWRTGHMVRFEKRLAPRDLAADPGKLKVRWKRLRVWEWQTAAAALAAGSIIALVLLNDTFRGLLTTVFWLTDWGNAALLAGILLGTGVAWRMGKFMVTHFGDVAIYFEGMDERSSYYKIRREILNKATGRLTELMGDPQYSDVLVAAHSLGSVIAYDTINEVCLIHRARRTRAAGGASVAKERRLSRKELGDMEFSFQKLKGFMSFGSPLDKVVYFFHQGARPRRVVRAQILSAWTAFHRVSSGRPYGDKRFERYEPAVPDGFVWHNAWCWWDPLGHKLDFFKLDDSAQPRMRQLPWAGHTGFWKNENFYRAVVGWLEIGHKQ